MTQSESQYADIRYVSPASSGITLIGILSTVVAGITILLALAGGLVAGIVASIATSNTPTTWTLTPGGATLGTVATTDPTATPAEVDFMVAGLLDRQSVGDVQEEHLRSLLAAHGRGAFPEAASADDVREAIQSAAPDGAGSVRYTIVVPNALPDHPDGPKTGTGAIVVNADGADWLDPLGARHFSGDVLEDTAEAEDMYEAFPYQVDDALLDAAIGRINDHLLTPLPPEEAELVRTHFADVNVMPLGWIDPAYIDEQLLSAERDETGALVVELSGGTYTLPAGSQNATYLMHNGMPNASRFVTGGWLAALGALGAFCGGGLLLAAGIQTLRLRSSAIWLHWLAVAALLVATAVAISGCVILSTASAYSPIGATFIAVGIVMAVPTLYALFLIGALLFSPLRRL